MRRDRQTGRWTRNRTIPNRWLPIGVAVVMGIGFMAPRDSSAFTVEVSSGQFTGQTNVYSSVTSFSISIEVLEPLASGAFVNPALGDIEFLIRGTLDPTTPARMANPLFTGFAVDDLATLRGQDFYDLGNALSFEIAGGADLTDGLQVSELVGPGLVFEFDGRELGTGRYHPPILQLFSDGTGSLRNSNNTGGINPFTGVEVNAMVGDEYIAELTFDPAAMTLVTPEPGTALLLGLGLAALGTGGRSKRPVTDRADGQRRRGHRRHLVRPRLCLSGSRELREISRRPRHDESDFD